MAAEATATGTLGGTPVANLLIYVLDRRLTGTLVIQDPEGRRSAITLRGGVPIKVKLPEPMALLSAVLVDSKMIDQGTAGSTFEASRVAQKLHGEHLLELGLLDADRLDEALGEQVFRKLEWLAVAPNESVFGYYDGQDYLLGYGGADAPTVEPLTAIWRALRKQATDDVVSATLARLGDRPVRLHPNSRVGRFGFEPRERGVIDVLRAKPQPLPSLVGSGLLPAPELRKILYALVVTRHLDLGGNVAPVGTHPTPSQAPPEVRPAETPPATPAAEGAAERKPGAAARDPAGRRTGPVAPVAAPTPAEMSAEGAEFAAEIRARADKIGSQNYYEILGIERTAPTSAIQTAFFQLAKRWHPDRLGAELGDARELAIRVFARMSEAHQVLMNDEQRKEYERLMKEGGSTADEQEVVQRVLRAASAFQRAEILVRRGNLDEALKQCEIAVENDGEQAEYVALYADLLSQQPDRAKNGIFTDVLKLVNEAKKRQPQNMKVRLYRARVLKRSGDLDTAHKEFRAIVEQDASNVEAAREVRLYQMRKGKTTTDPQKKAETSGDGRGKPDGRGKTDPRGKEAGLFNKFFKR